jgi:hypothetical protein
LFECKLNLDEIWCHLDDEYNLIERWQYTHESMMPGLDNGYKRRKFVDEACLMFF